MNAIDTEDGFRPVAGMNLKLAEVTRIAQAIIDPLTKVGFVEAGDPVILIRDNTGNHGERTPFLDVAPAPKGVAPYGVVLARPQQLTFRHYDIFEIGVLATSENPNAFWACPMKETE